MHNLSAILFRSESIYLEGRVKTTGVLQQTSLRNKNKIVILRYCNSGISEITEEYLNLLN